MIYEQSPRILGCGQVIVKPCSEALFYGLFCIVYFKLLWLFENWALQRSTGPA